MTVRNVKKNLAGQQDLLPGVGPYSQIRRGVAVSIDGPAKSYIELWKSYCGDAYVGTFEDGFTASTGNVAVSLILGRAYRYTGATQVTVAKDSSPDISWSELVASTDSLLVREALRRSYAGAGYNLVDGSFEGGGTLVNVNDVLLQESTGRAFSGPAGAVAVGTDPLIGGFTDVSNSLLVGKTETISTLRQTIIPGVLFIDVIEHRAGCGFGGRRFRWDPTSTLTDNGATVIAVVGVATGRWVMDYEELDAGWFGLPLDPGQYCHVELAAIEAIMASEHVNCHFHNGEYVVQNANFPWKNPASPASSYKDYRGAKIICDGPGVIFKTVSVNGADVWQLNAVSGLSIIGWPTVTATISSQDNAGSNGVSVTNGGQNLYVEIEAENLPFTVKPTYLDGGKAVSLQNGSALLLGNKNITLKCRRAKNCAYGFTADMVLDGVITNPQSGIIIDVVAEDCYRAGQVSGSEPTLTVPTNGVEFGMTIKLTSVNCQQAYIEARGWNVDSDVHVVNTKTAANLRGKNPNDTTVIVDSVLASKGGRCSVIGSVTDVDVLHRWGGLSTTGFTGNTQYKKATLNVAYQLATTVFDFVNAGGNSVANCVFELFRMIGTSFVSLVAGNNSVVHNGIPLDRDAKILNTLTVSDTSDAKKFGIRNDGGLLIVRTTASAPGATSAGKIAVYDPVTGTLTGYIPLFTS